MMISRRSFLKYCTSAAGALGLSRFQLQALADALGSPDAPTILWLQGAGCTGCSISFLNHISDQAPHDAGEVLIDVINLAYHPNVMAAAGAQALQVAKDCYAAGGYVLVVEGGVPTAFGGNTCWAWQDCDHHVTFHEAVTQYAENAAAVVCVGQCSSYGGMWKAPPNPTGIQSVSQATGQTTINVAGCPPHPDWVIWVVARLIAGQPIPLDAYGRPSALYASTVHNRCPLRETEEAHTFGIPGRCLEELGCRGESTRGNCPDLGWNGGVNWCVGAGAPCIGCTSPSFPGSQAFFEFGDDD